MYEHKTLCSSLRVLFMSTHADYTSKIMPKIVLFHYYSYLNLNFIVLPRVTAQILV
jgi:hypothetical protein